MLQTGWNPLLAPAWPEAKADLIGPAIQVTAPTGPVVSLTDAKGHLRVESTEDDSLISGLVAAAAELVQREVPGTRQLLTATYDVPVQSFWIGALRLPSPPLQSVLSIKYYDLQGVSQTVDPALYEARAPLRQPGTICLLPYKWWPLHQPWRQWPVTIRMTCGYGTADQVPVTLKQAILLLVGQWYIRREAQSERTLNDVGYGVRALLDSQGWGSYA